LLLNDALRFNEVGRHAGAVEFTGEIRTASGLVLDPPRTFAVSFVVSSRNATALDQALSRLTTVALTANVADQLDAVKALRVVRDPIVVKHLKQILAHTIVHDFAILHALAQIRSNDARLTLEAATASENAERAEIARNALSRSRP
jgi:hypothetical protein